MLIFFGFETWLYSLAIILFLTIVLVVFSFGAAAYAPSSVLGSRLRALGWQRTEAERKTAIQGTTGTGSRSSE